MRSGITFSNKNGEYLKEKIDDVGLLFIVHLTTLSVAQTIVRIASTDCMLNNELEWMCKDPIVVLLKKYCCSICQEGLRNITGNLSEVSRCSGRDFNWAYPEYKVETLHLELTSSG
jgi:hypothetical protein